VDRKKRLRQTLIAREGLKFIIPSLVLSIIFYIFFYYTLAFLSFFFLLFCLFFFRNPKRSTKEPEDCLISPADGKVTEIKEITEDEFLGSEAVRVSIFMSLASVHVNRAPGDGRIVRVEHRPGKFELAWKTEVDKENERNYILIEGDDEKILVVQIAGFLARRITSYVHEGDTVKRGDLLGIIAFGSRVDIYLPKSYECMVKLHEMVKAGTTLLARRRGTT
jgi:phosphatidylserine decarboxylase